MRLPWIVPLTLLSLTACAGKGAREDLAPPISSTADWIRDEGVVPMDLTQQDPLAYATRVRKAVQPLSNQVRKCYRQALKASPRLYGEMEVALEVGIKGQVDRAFVQYSDIPDLELEACVLPLYQHLELPSPGEGPQIVTYPYVFSSKRTPREVKQTLVRLHNLQDPDEASDPQKKEGDEFDAPW